MSEPANRLIQSLNPEDAEALRSLLRPVDLEAGQVVVEQDDVIAEVHFPIDCEFANQTRFRDGSAVETAVIGLEGVTGLAPFLADEPCGWEVAARAPGRALAANAAALRSFVMDRPRVLRRFLQLADFYQGQAAQTAACNASHTLVPRVARWLLTAHDLAGDRPIRFTQDELSRMLGVQRTTVSDAAHKLKASRWISYNRGVIAIRDRAGLEDVACECYGMIRRRLVAIGLSGGQDGN